MTIIDNFEALLANGQDNALLRFSLGNAYLNEGDQQKAVEHLRAAVELDPRYSAAWKMLGKALSNCGKDTEAVGVYQQGIQVAEAKGDKQAAKEMRVFKTRLERNLSTDK